MKNVLNKLSFYKSTTVMLVETSIGVVYGEANPFVQFKFAPRADANSQGQWDDANCFWITSYIELWNFVNGMNAVATGKLEKYEMKNPKKGSFVQIRSSVNESTKVEYMNFFFSRGQDVKIKPSLVKGTEFAALFAYFKNLLDTFNTTSAIALMRNDIHYEFFMKGKENKNTNQSGGNSGGGNKYNNGNNNQSGGNAGGNKYNQNTQNKKPQQQQVDDAVNSMGEDFGGFSGGAPDFGDVPF